MPSHDAARALRDVQVQFTLLADTSAMTRSIKRCLRETLRFELVICRPGRVRRLVIRYRLWRLRNV